MKNLFLFLILVLSVGFFSESKVLKTNQEPVRQLKPHQQVQSVSNQADSVSVKKEKSKPKPHQQTPSVSSQANSVSVKKTSKKVADKESDSSRRKPSSEESDYSLKEELVGEDYYQTVDSKMIQRVVNRHLGAIEGLCSITDSAEKIKEWNKRSQALTQLADQYVDNRRLVASDEYLLRSLRYYTSPGRLSYGQEITQDFLNEVSLYEEFKAQYYVDNRLNSDTPIEELPDKWAQKIAKGLSCF